MCGDACALSFPPLIKKINFLTVLAPSTPPNPFPHGSQACEQEVPRLCGDACAPSSSGETCGGRVLRCLTTKRSDIEDSVCAAEVAYFSKMEVSEAFDWAWQFTANGRRKTISRAACVW